MPNNDSKSNSICADCGSVERYASGICKPCTKVNHAAWRAAHPEKMKAYGAAYRAANRDKLIANKRAAYVYQPDKEKIRGALYREKNKEKEAAKKAAWAKANPELIKIKGQVRRAKKLGSSGVLSKGLKEKLFNLQGGKCPCCKQDLGQKYHMDHIMPLALGGSNTDDNIQLLRQFCNHQKHSKHPVDFMQSKGFLL